MKNWKIIVIDVILIILILVFFGSSFATPEFFDYHHGDSWDCKSKVNDDDYDPFNCNAMSKDTDQSSYYWLGRLENVVKENQFVMVYAYLTPKRSSFPFFDKDLTIEYNLALRMKNANVAGFQY